MTVTDNTPMKTTPSFAVIVLAAGKGTRMKSEKAKVLHELFYAPMIHHVLNSIIPLAPSKIVVIVGHQRQEVNKALTDFEVTTAVQEEQLGTGHAVLCGQSALGDEDDVMILCGDTPLLKAETLQQMYDQHRKSGSTITLMTTLLDCPTNYGRILCDEHKQVQAIVEEKDATAEQKEIKEINAGIYCVKKSFLFDTLQQVGTDNSQGEVYLTDIVGLAVAGGQMVNTFTNPDAQDVLGVNSRVELAQAHSELQMRHNIERMLQGISMEHPETISIAPTATIGQDTLIQQNVRISGATHIGNSSTLESGAIIHDSSLGENVRVGAYSYLDTCTVAAGSAIPPHSHIRGES